MNRRTLHAPLLVTWLATLCVSLGFCGVPLVSQARADMRWYDYYEEAEEYLDNEQWLYALENYQAALSLEFEDKKKKRAYGMRFLKYFPHRGLGIVYFNLNEPDKARKELELSLAYHATDDAEKYLQLINQGIPGNFQKEPVKEEEPEVAPSTGSTEEPPVPEKMDESEAPAGIIQPLGSESPKIHVNPETAPRLGYRLSLAVLPFECEETLRGIQIAVFDEMIEQLVNLRRFHVIERAKLKKVLSEQALGHSGVVAKETAVELGRIVQADVIISGSLIFDSEKFKLNIRLVNTESAVTLAARDAVGTGSGHAGIENVVGEIVRKISLDLPLVEGLIIEVEDDHIILDMGGRHGIREGMTCIAFEEGPEYKHPRTGKSLGIKRNKVGELLIVQVHENFVVAQQIKNPEIPFNIGQGVIVK